MRYDHYRSLGVKGAGECGLDSPGIEQVPEVGSCEQGIKP